MFDFTLQIFKQLQTKQTPQGYLHRCYISQIIGSVMFDFIFKQLRDYNYYQIFCKVSTFNSTKFHQQLIKSYAQTFKIPANSYSLRL